jgi:hypothetical protein
MSGGSWEYLYAKMRTAADRLSRSEDPLRRALVGKMLLLSEAMRAIELVDSYDRATGGDRAAILKALGMEYDPEMQHEFGRDMELAHARLREIVGDDPV